MNSLKSQSLILFFFSFYFSSFAVAEVEIFLGDEKVLVNSNNGQVISSEPVEIATSNIPPVVSSPSQEENQAKQSKVVSQEEILEQSSLSFNALTRNSGDFNSQRYFPTRNHTSKRQKTLKAKRKKEVLKTFKLIKKRKDPFGQELLAALKHPEVIVNLNRLKNKDSLRFKTALRKLGRQRNSIEKVLEKNQIPAELLAIAFVESNFDPKAISSQEALGMWQFIEPTGKFYGLESREDFFNSNKASLAAASYLKDLHNSLEDWVLVIASYNAGEGRVRQAIKLAGGSRSFWEIQRYLPRETQKYVPHVLAAAAIMYEYQIEN